MEAEEAESSTPQSSVISSVVGVDKKKAERPSEASNARYLESVRELDLEDLLAGVGRSPGTQERVTRGLESTPLGGLVEGPRGAILKRTDWDPAEVDNGASQL